MCRPLDHGEALPSAAADLFAGAIAVYDPDHVHLVLIDNWFGPRWLGFEGKCLGAFGVWIRRELDGAAIPPFHPHRVLKERAFERSTSGAWRDIKTVAPLHGARLSERNTRMPVARAVPGRSVVAWAGTRGSAWSLMLYAMAEPGETRWYVDGPGPDLYGRRRGLTQAELDLLRNRGHAHPAAAS